jgi:hypothetical protein
LNFIDFLGELLSKELKFSIFAARGLLKLSIKDELGPFYSINKINYETIKKVITNSLFSRLNDLDIANPLEIRDFLLEELNKNQSLLTFEKV